MTVTLFVVICLLAVCNLMQAAFLFALWQYVKTPRVRTQREMDHYE